MNILFIKDFFVGFMISEIPSVRIRALSVFGYKKVYFPHTYVCYAIPYMSTSNSNSFIIAT